MFYRKVDLPAFEANTNKCDATYEKVSNGGTNIESPVRSHA